MASDSAKYVGISPIVRKITQFTPVQNGSNKVEMCYFHRFTQMFWFFTQNVEVQHRFDPRQHLAAMDTRSIGQRGLLGSPCNRIQLVKGSDEQGSVIVVPLRDHRERRLAKNEVGAHDGVKRPQARIIRADMLCRDPQFDQGIFHGFGFVVGTMPIVSTHQQMGNLPGMVEPGCCLNAILEEGVGRTTPQVARGSENQADLVFGKCDKVLENAGLGALNNPQIGKQNEAWPDQDQDEQHTDQPL